MTERTKFMARLENAREAGLVDVKFFFNSDKPVKPAAIFAALNEIEEAIKNGHCVRHKEWSGNEPKLVSS